MTDMTAPRKRWTWWKVLLVVVAVAFALSVIGVFVRPLVTDDNNGHGFGEDHTGQVTN